MDDTNEQQTTRIDLSPPDFEAWDHPGTPQAAQSLDRRRRPQRLRAPAVVQGDLDGGRHWQMEATSATQM
jgi:hypothetical protein